jgi:mevalonate kinase
LSLWRRFQTEVPAKWLLAGEHAVLRGGTAIAIPHPEMKLSFSFEPDSSASDLTVIPESSRESVFDLLQSVRDRLGEEGRTLAKPEGTLTIESTIPVGAGLGSSAALCVAMARWLSGPMGIEGESALYELACELEHRFHGRSSGVDVAVALAGKPISFVQGQGYRVLGIRKLPRFTFHDCGLRARTSECVYRVDVLREENPILGLEIDEKMGHAARAAMEGLVCYDQGMKEAGYQKLALGMHLAQECFYSWRLISGDARRIEESLLAQDALAVKMTGAGGGGFVVALWKD